MPFVDAADLKIHYLEQGAGTPVVFIHGNWATSSWWELVLDRLPAGLRGLAYDMRGRGQTAGSDTGYSIPALAGDLLAFARALHLEPFHVVGHSLGSAVAMQFALEHGEALRSLTVISPAWVDGMPEAYAVPAGQEALKADADLFAQSLKPLAPAAPDDDFWKRLVAEGHGQSLRAALDNIPALLDWKPGDGLRRIAAPKLVISGALDGFTGGDNAERAAAALGAPHIVMPGVGHSPNVEAPDQFTALLVEHIAPARARAAG